MTMKDERLKRLDAQRWSIVNRFGIDATLFASPDVPIESSAIDELSTMLEVQQTVNDMARADSAIFDEVAAIFQ